MAFINLLIPSAAGGPFTVGGYWLLRFPAVLFLLQLQKYVLAKLVDYELCERMLERSLVPWAFKALVVSIIRYLYFLVGGPWCILQHQLV
jgi:hypothetical protein